MMSFMDDPSVNTYTEAENGIERHNTKTYQTKKPTSWHNT